MPICTLSKLKGEAIGKKKNGGMGKKIQKKIVHKCRIHSSVVLSKIANCNSKSIVQTTCVLAAMYTVYLVSINTPITHVRLYLHIV